MDWSFSEEQQDIQALARRILEDKVTEERLREIEGGLDRHDPDLYQALAEANLLGIAVPESAGGSGYGIIEQCLVLQEVGRTVAPVPVLASVVMGAMPVAQFGTDEQRAAYAAPAAEGSRILTAALVAPVGEGPVVAKPDGGTWRLAGARTCVPAGMIADAALVPAAVDDGLGVFVVDLDGAGVSRERQRVENKDSEAWLDLDGAAGSPLGSVEAGSAIVDWIELHATVGLCAVQLGVTERALEMTARYAQDRVQFDRPIATFQAVGQRCADAYIDVEAIRLTLWQAAWRLSEGLPAKTDVEVAKFWAADGGHRVAHAAVHLHGGMGVDVDYPLHRFYIHAKQIEFTLGGAVDQLLRIGATLAAEKVS